MAARKVAAAWGPVFLEALERCGSVSRAAAAAGVSASAVHKRRSVHPDFRRDCAGAMARWVEGGRADALARAAAVPVAPVPETLVVPCAGGARVEPLSPRRIGEKDRARFLEELGATGSVRRAAAAAGFSVQAFNRQRARDRAFGEAWAAAVELGRARLQDYLLEAAQATFDPETLPVSADAPKLSVREAMDLLKHGSGRGAGASRAGRYGAPLHSEEEVAAARAAIEEKLDRVRARLLAEGYREVEGGALVPPGYVRVDGLDSPGEIGL